MKWGKHLELRCAADHRIGDLALYGTLPPENLDQIRFLYGGQPSQFTRFVDAGDNFRVRCSGCNKEVCKYAPHLVEQLLDSDGTCILGECPE